MAERTTTRVLLTTTALLAAPIARAAPLPLYDTARDSTELAPLPPAPACTTCSPVPDTPKRTTLPFYYGGAVSGLVGGGRGGSFSGQAVSAWIKPKDVPVTIFFDFQRFQPLGK